jgi:hypothetical protein
MLGMDILDVAVGLFFGYLVLSLAVTAANEMSAAWVRRRAWMLHKGVSNLLNDDRLAASFYDHPLIQSLSSPPGLLSRVPLLRRFVGRGPSYIRSRTFAVALLDVVEREVDPRTEGSSHIQRVLALLRREAGNDPEKLREGIETWFNDSMERVSGWYRRRTQVLLLLWAAIVTVATNSDTLVIAKALWRDPALRQTLVQRAERYAAEQPAPGTIPVVVAVDGAPPPPPLPPDQQADVDFAEASAQYDAALADLAELQLPIGWEAPSTGAAGDTSIRLVTDTAVDDWPGAIWAPGGFDRWVQATSQHFVGWLLTILAVSLGAPFWFDTLNRIIAIRGAGNPPAAAQKPQKKTPAPAPEETWEAQA